MELKSLREIPACDSCFKVHDNEKRKEKGQGASGNKFQKALMWAQFCDGCGQKIIGELLNLHRSKVSE